MHLNLWDISHTKEQVALLFRRLEVDIMETWDDEGKAFILNLLWKKPLVPQQQGCTECTYYMMLNLLNTSTHSEKTQMQFLMVASDSP